MTMRYLCVLLLCLTIGCSAAKTSIDSGRAVLKPPTYEGSLQDIHQIAYKAALRAFPEEDDIYREDNGKVVIERDWFWRGDTIIEVWVKKVNETECVIEAESKGNWHRGNAALFNVSEGELKHYMSAIQLEYEDFKTGQGAYEISNPTMKKLQQLKEAFDSGLITEEEYAEKRKKVLDEL